MDKKRWQDWVLLVGGAWLFLAPWLLGTADNTASSWNAWILGILVVGTAWWALAKPSERAPEWLQGIYGLWLFVAPWVLGFASLVAAAWNAWIIGAGLILLAVLAYAEVASVQGTQRGGPSDHMVTHG